MYRLVKLKKLEEIGINIMSSIVREMHCNFGKINLVFDAINQPAIFHVYTDKHGWSYHDRYIKKEYPINNLIEKVWQL